MDAKEVTHIAKLARLKFEGEELGKVTEDISSIIKWIDVLQKADTSGVKNLPENNTPLRMRQDEVKAENMSEDLTKNATEPYEHFFTVPKMVE